MQGYRTLTMHSAIFSTQTEIEMAACNIFHILRIFGVSLEAKYEFIKLLGNSRNIVYIADNYVSMEEVLNHFRAVDVEQLRSEYDAIRQSCEEKEMHLRKLILLFGNLVYKCVGSRFGLWRSQTHRAFKTFDLKTTTSYILPELRDIPLIIEDD